MQKQLVLVAIMLFSIKSMIATISNYKMANITPEKALEFAGSFQGEIKKAKVYKEYLE